jgi:hypothetical protein
MSEESQPVLGHGECFLVSCVSKKGRIATGARDLYTSEWFTKARAYVEVSEAPWFILSAEHGLLAPDEIIAPYEKTLNRMGVAERRGWAKRVIAQMDSKLPTCEQIVLFAGARYREFLMDYLGRRAQRVIVPLEGLRLGQQLAWLSRHKPGVPRA